MIFERVWGYDFGAELELARGLHRLPAAQDRGGRRAARCIHTVRGVGYVLRERVTLRARRLDARRAAAAVAIAVVLASAIAYVVVRGQLRGQVDDALREQAPRRSRASRRERAARRRRRRSGCRSRARALGGAPAYVADRARATARVVRPRRDACALPVDPRDARGRAPATRGAFFADAHVDGAHVRVLTVPLAGGDAVQIARPLARSTTRSSAALALVLVALGGIALAAGLGRAGRARRARARCGA